MRPATTGPRDSRSRAAHTATDVSPQLQLLARDVPRPRGRDLDVYELRAFALALARRKELWGALVRHDPEQRVYQELTSDPHVSAWIICWMDDHDTGYHDHNISAGAVAVIQGSVREERLVLGGQPRVTRVGAGGSFYFAPRRSTASATTATSPPSPCTSTRRRCSRWAPTRPAPTARCSGARCPTKRS
jgi:Cysteine dioxygenase type I